MKKISFLLVLILSLAGCSSWFSGFPYDEINVTFEVEGLKSEYSFGDEISVNVEIENNSDKRIEQAYSCGEAIKVVPRKTSFLSFGTAYATLLIACDVPEDPIIIEAGEVDNFTRNIILKPEEETNYDNEIYFSEGKNVVSASYDFRLYENNDSEEWHTLESNSVEIYILPKTY